MFNVTFWEIRDSKTSFRTCRTSLEGKVHHLMRQPIVRRRAPRSSYDQDSQLDETSAVSHIESDPNNTCVAHLSSFFAIRPGKLRRKVWISRAHGPNKRLPRRKYGNIGASDMCMGVAQDRVVRRKSMGGQQSRFQKYLVIECVFRSLRNFRSKIRIR